MRRKGKPVQVYLTEEEKQKIQELALMKNQSMSTFIKEQLFNNSILIGTSQGEEFQNAKMNLKSIEEKVGYVFNKMDKDHYFVKRWLRVFLIDFFYMVKYLKGDDSNNILIQRRLKSPDLYVSYQIDKIIFEYSSNGVRFEDTEQYKKEYKKELER